MNANLSQPHLQEISEKCSLEHLYAMHQILMLPLITAPRTANEVNASSTVMDHADKVLSNFLKSNYIIAFSSWPVNEEWSRHLDYRCRAIRSTVDFTAVDETWKRVTKVMESEKLSMTRFLDFLQKSPEYGKRRFFVELSLDTAIVGFPISISHLHERMSKPMVHKVEPVNAEAIWKRFCPNADHETWLARYLECVTEIAATVNAKKLYLVPFYGEQSYFYGKEANAFGGAMTIYCSDSISDSLMVHLTLHQLANLLFRTIEEPRRLQQVAERKGRESQLIEILSVFGHDAKNWAAAIAGVLETNWNGCVFAAKSFSDSLTGRLVCYSRFSAAAFDQKSEIGMLRRDLEDAMEFRQLDDVFYGEIDAIIAQDLTRPQKQSKDESRKLFERYFTSTDLDNRRRCLCQNGIDVKVSGLKLAIPSIVISRTPLLLCCIRLILSELLRNIVKYQWNYDLFEDTSKTKRILLSVCESDGGESYLFEITCRPWKNASLPDEKSFVGLISIKLALMACGGMPLTSTSIGSSSSAVLPFPNADGVSQFIIPKSLFKNV